MSANLDLVRSIYADWERGDCSLAEWADPDTEVVIADGPAPGMWTGRPGRAQSHRELLSAMEDLRMVADEYRELDDERVLVLAHVEGRGKTRGRDLGQSMPDRWGADLFHVRDGHVTRLVIYYDTTHALADPGLEEWVVSQENVELILGCVAAYNARNLDAWAEFFDPEVEAIPDPTFLESNRVHGRDAYRAWTEQLTHGLVSLWWETTELLDLGPDRVLHGGDWCGRGSASGIETRSNITGVFTIRGEQITRVEFYFDHHDALKAVGLEE